MSIELQRRLAQHLRVLNKAIRRMVARSAGFEDLRKLLRDEQVELAIYVVPMVGGKVVGEELRCELTDGDRQFLRQAGIRFDDGAPA